MSLPAIASAARLGNVEFVSRLDGDLDRPVAPVEPEPLDGEDPDAFAERAEAFETAMGDYSKAMAAFGRRLKAARETQDWSDVLKPGANPVIFVCKPIEYDVMEAFEGERKHAASDLAAAGLLVRMSLVEIRGPGFESFKVPAAVTHTRIDPDTKRPTPTEIGKVAPVSILRDIARRCPNGKTAKAVITDLGEQIFAHWERAPVP